ncbi:MAG TPA: hypothetical protein VJC18_06655 [bacterium]|nr:hypothetical protein [bacterium]
MVVILNRQFLPENLVASSGQTIFFSNLDDTPHHILSQSGINLFDDTGLFDTDIIPENGATLIVIPEDVSAGGLLYYYDDIMRGEMHTPTGTITIK